MRAIALSVVALASMAWSATSTRVVPTALVSNGFGFSFDGRLAMGSGGLNGSTGWFVAIGRLESVGVASGLPEFSTFLSAPLPVQAQLNAENTFAFCEASPQPTRCNPDGAPNPAGAHDCYRLWVFDSPDRNAPNELRRRQLGVLVNDPRTATASVGTFQWLAPIAALQPTLRGIEPTISRDGRLMIWQGHPSNDGTTDSLVYSYNPAPCEATGWSAPRSITSMATDPLVMGRYRLAEQPLRGADGTPYPAGAPFPGAHPFLFPGGEALGFTAVIAQCQPGGGPPGCGTRSAGVSIIGAPTRWQLALVDGEVNPDADATVRLHAVTPGPLRPHFPTTAGEAWPLFGNLGTYAELSLDDVPPSAVGVWHFNELVTGAGALDRTRTPDLGGLALTGAVLGGATFPQTNNGRLGKALRFDGLSGRVEIAHAPALEPASALTVELSVKPAVTPDCDANDNARVLLTKPGAYGLMLEDGLRVTGSVQVAGGATYRLSSPSALPLGLWSAVALQYHAATGTLSLLVNGNEVARSSNPPAGLVGAGNGLFVGSRGVRAACPAGDGAFSGDLDELAIFSVWRTGTPGTDAGSTGGGTSGGTPTAGGAPNAGGDSAPGGGLAGGGMSGGAMGAGGGTSGGAAAGGNPGGGAMASGGKATSGGTAERKEGLSGWRLACGSADLAPLVVLVLLRRRRR